jgi:hypothetical protein
MDDKRLEKEMEKLGRAMNRDFAEHINAVAWEIADKVVESVNNSLLKEFTADYEEHVEEAWAVWHEMQLNCSDGLGSDDADASVLAVLAEQDQTRLIREHACKRAVEILRDHLSLSLPKALAIRRKLFSSVSTHAG